MDQKQLLKISLAITLIGIINLLIISNIQKAPLTNISEINTNQLNKNLKIQGTIFNIKSFNQTNFQIISIRDSTGKIDITSNQILDIKNNHNITVIGKVVDYKQYLQIQANKIIITN
jgi:DNA/RNA endonuclease YhcR with UshA esterase domain